MSLYVNSFDTDKNLITLISETLSPSRSPHWGLTCNSYESIGALLLFYTHIQDSIRSCKGPISPGSFFPPEIVQKSQFVALFLSK